MSNEIKASGSCLCGSVSIVASSVSGSVGACHCNSCRKWTGGPLLAVDCGNNVVFEGEDNISVFNSSEWAERGFCKLCGSHLFYRLKETSQYIMPAGLFDQEKDFVLDHQIFIEEQPSYYCFANETTNMTGAEVFAQFAATE